MSNVLENAPVKRRRGRPRKNPLPTVEQPIEVTQKAETFTQSASKPEFDDALLEYDLGDISAQMASKTRLGARPELGILYHLPDLNYPGTIVHKHNPTWQFQRAWLEEDGSRFSRQTAIQMKARGWKPAMAEDFLICPELREAIVPDDSGRLIFADMSGKSAASLMVRDKADMERINKENLKHSDSIQLSAEEKVALLEEKLNREGMRGVRASSSITDD